MRGAAVLKYSNPLVDFLLILISGKTRDKICEDYFAAARRRTTAGGELEVFVRLHRRCQC